jgi:hypothetical protein
VGSKTLDCVQEMLLNRCLLRVPRTTSRIRMASRIVRVGLQKRFFRYDGIPARELLAPEGWNLLISRLKTRTIRIRNIIYYRCCRREYHRLELVSVQTTDKRFYIFRSYRLRNGIPPITLLIPGSIIHSNSSYSTISTGSTTSTCKTFLNNLMTPVINPLLSRSLQSTNCRTILHRSAELLHSLPSTPRPTPY